MPTADRDGVVGGRSDARHTSMSSSSGPRYLVRCGLARRERPGRRTRTAHGEVGTALLSQHALGLGLAAVVLAEFVVSQRVTVQTGALRVVDR
jgi:hypothetical protein